MSAVQRLSDATLDLAADAVRRRTGLVFSPARRAALAEGLKRAMMRAHEPDVSAYLARLADDRALLEDLATEITVAESYFFRAPEQIAVAVELVRAALAQRRQGPLRVWSAGCAGGEEPYTLAIALHRAGLAGEVHLLATDLSPRALERARHGRYGRWSLRGVDLDVVRTYFKSIRDDFELIPEIRGAVEFRCLNLAEDSYPSLASGAWGMDLILCRNVLIYFDAETATQVVRRLVDCLGPAGSLVLGASDPAIADRIPCDVVMTSAGLVYRQAARSVPAAAPSPASCTVEAPDAPAPPREQEPPRTLAAPAAPELPAAPLESLASSLAARPESEEVAAKAAQCYADRDYTDAASLAQQEVHRNADALPSWTVLVRSLANMGRLAEAGRACATALDRHRTSAELHYLHAVLLSEAGRHADAATAARRALYLHPKLVVAHLALATALARSGATIGARHAVRNAEQLLKAMPPGAPVQAGDGESAGRLLVMAHAYLHLLGEAA